MITEETLTERVLGGLNEITVSTRRVYVATSNNARLDADTVSRCVMIRIDTEMEQPESRKYQSDPLRYIQQNRAHVIGAIVTLVRHWQENGPHAFANDRVSRFPEWSRIMGGMLHAAGIEGFLSNVNDAINRLDPELETWREFAEAWWQQHGIKYVTATQLLPWP